MFIDKYELILQKDKNLLTEDDVCDLMFYAMNLLDFIESETQISMTILKSKQYLNSINSRIFDKVYV